MKTLLIYLLHFLFLLSLSGCLSKKGKDTTGIDEELPYMETNSEIMIGSDFRFQDTGLFMNYHGRANQIDPENILNLKDFIKDDDVRVSYIEEVEMLIITLKESENGWKSYLATSSSNKGIYTIGEVMLVDSDQEGIRFYIPHGIEGIFAYKKSPVIYVTSVTEDGKVTTPYRRANDKFQKRTYMFHGSETLVEYDLGDINGYICFEDPEASWDVTYCRLPFSTADKEYDLVIRKLNSRVPKDYLCVVKDGKIDLENALYLTSHIPDNVDEEDGFYNYYEILNDTTIVLDGDEHVKGWTISGKRYYRISDDGKFYAVRKIAEGEYEPIQEEREWTSIGYYDRLEPIILPIMERKKYREFFTYLPYRLYDKFITPNAYLYEEVKVGKLVSDTSVNIVLVDGENPIDDAFTFVATFTDNWSKIDYQALAYTSYYGYESRRVRDFTVAETGVMNVQENWDGIIVLNEYYTVDNEGNIVEYAEENLEVTHIEAGEEGGDYMVSTYVWEWNGKRWIKELVKEEKYIWQGDDSTLVRYKNDDEE